MYQALFEENCFGHVLFLQTSNNFLPTFAVGRRVRVNWLERLGAQARDIPWPSLEASTVQFSIASHRVRLDPTGDAIRPGRPGWWWLFASHSPARPRPGTCRSAAGTRGPRRFTFHPPPAAVSRRFLRPPPLAACARLISLSARGFLARALPAPLPLAVSPPASSPEAACDDRRPALAAALGATVRPRRAGEPRRHSPVAGPSASSDPSSQ